MFRINQYFDGKVASIAFQSATLPATVGVMAVGEFEFGTSQRETMTVVSGALIYYLARGLDWRGLADGQLRPDYAGVRPKIYGPDQPAAGLRFLDRAEVEAIMLPHLGTGYFMVDLAGIRDDLKRLPMVHEVTVRRAWPDRLMVFITEQVPVLRFGEDAYLNPYAEVFRPAAGLPGLELPQVAGPAAPPGL